MSNININYKTAIILKQALREKVEIKENLIISGIKLSEKEINYLEQDKRALKDFSNKIDLKWGEKKKNEKSQYSKEAKNDELEKEYSYFNVINTLIILYIKTSQFFLPKK